MIVWDADGKPRGAGSIHFSRERDERAEPRSHRREPPRAVGALRLRRRFVSASRCCAPNSRALDARARSRGRCRSATDARSSAALVVGSDGAASLSRKLAGIETAGWDYDQRAFVTHVRTEHPHARTAWQRFLADGPIAFLPLADGRSSIVWTTRPAHARAPRRRVRRKQAARRSSRRIDGVLGRVEVAGPRAHFPLRLTHARQYCKERFALVGDAAHSIHPLAGQGVNLGFLDCAALVRGAGAGARERRRRRSARRAARAATLRALAQEREPDRARAGRRAEPPVQHVRTARSAGSAAPGSSAVDRSALAKRFFMGRAMGTARRACRGSR